MRGFGIASSTAFLAMAAALWAPTAAQAHVAVASGPASAGTNQEIAFSVGHGCAGSDGKQNDTISIAIEIPDSVTSVRAVPNAFGKFAVQKKGVAGATSTTVTWQKAAGDALAADDGYYKLGLRIAVPNVPFSTVYFVVHQTCQTASGPITVDWAATAPNPSEDAGVGEPAAALLVLPAHQPGWNKFTVPVAVTADTVKKLFADAEIVWKGTAAFSINPTTQAQAGATTGVTVLGDLAAGDEIWVKY